MRARRHLPSSGPLFQSGPWRAFLRDLGLILATFILGYGISALWLTPGSIFSKDHALPRVLEMPDAKARQKLTELGFRPRLDGERPNDSFPAGTVIWQDPAPGTVLEPNSVVQLVLSTGPALVAVPDVVGLNVPQASKILAAAGVRVGTIDSTSAGQEQGVVIATRPASGVGRPRGAAVALVVSRGAPEAEP
ncbi:MAG TPA: PASTA domain-containing protein [Gemmatimonadales bacterium]|nr:PASTA domain-containing protein [Gemmatimonadales bacterium]